jgi:hypothetical protein
VKFFFGFKTKIEALTTTIFFKTQFFFAYGLGLMHVTESLPAKTWGSRPTGLGGVVVSASLAPQQRIANDPNEALTVIKVSNEGYKSYFFVRQTPN